MRDVVAKRLFLNPRPNNFNILKAKKKIMLLFICQVDFFLKSHNLTEFFPVNILEPVEYNKYKQLELEKWFLRFGKKKLANIWSCHGMM